MDRRWPTLLSVILVFLAALAVNDPRATWGYLEAQELLEETDLIVVATLSEASEITANGVDYGQGILKVERVVYPSSETEIESLLLRWRNRTNLGCPRIDPRPHAEQALVWLLTRSDDGTVRADYPRRMIQLADPSFLERFLSEAWPLSGDDKYDAKVLALDGLLRIEATPTP